MFSERIFLFIACFVGYFDYCAFGQDNHYWTQQYGGRSALMAGAAVAGANDNSAIFYNPSLLPFIDKKELSVSANIYKAEFFTLENGAGDNLSLISNRYDTYPQMISGIIFFKKNKKLRAGYTLLTKLNTQTRFNVRHVFTTDVISAEPGLEDYVGAFEYNNQINEQWAGASLGYKISDHFAFGITQFLAYRFQSYLSNSYVRVFPESQTYMTSSDNTMFLSYNDIRAVTKVGLCRIHRKKPWRYGMAITLPSIPIFGLANVQREQTIMNIERAIQGNPNYVSRSITDRRTNLRSVYATPASIALGVEYHAKKAKYAIAIEYFTKQKRYYIIKSDSLPLLKPNNVYVANLGKFLWLNEYKNPVTNVAVGFEHELKKRLTMQMGIRTNFSYSYVLTESQYSEYESQEQFSISNNTSAWDLIHLSIGGTLQRKTGEVSVGIDYGFSSKKPVGQFVDFKNPKAENYFYGNYETDAIPKLNSLTAIISYTHYLKTTH
ncbi:MAG: hypothetical protein RML38_05555 [Bacteroidia bacterium]|nr:hypothetical protein [Bacteroidia bacterium]